MQDDVPRLAALQGFAAYQFSAEGMTTAGLFET